MEDLLPYYERELAFLRHYSRDFAKRYPKIAGRLLMAPGTSEDPHVEHLIEAFALMGARISKKIEDSYPELTESLLDVLYPHYLRPFPACSIAHFDLGNTAAKLTSIVQVPRGTELLSRPVNGVQCRFRTAYDVQLSPLLISAVKFLPIAKVPTAISLSAQAGAQISVHFSLQGQTASLTALGQETVRLFIDGEPSLCAVLRDALMLNVQQVFVEPEIGKDSWLALSDNPLTLVGMSENESLIDFPARSQSAFRLLTEYFAFPEKFGFFDLDLSSFKDRVGREFSLHFILKDIAPDSVEARLMDVLTKDNFKQSCSPVVNLFSQASDPIHVSQTKSSYPIVADSRRAWAYEIHSIDHVSCIRKTQKGDEVIEYPPFYSLQHGEAPDANESYWVARRNHEVAHKNPGYEMELSMVDIAFDPTTPSIEILSCDVTCTNRDLPSQLAYGIQGGDLVMEGGSLARSISLLRKPTRSWRFDSEGGNQWRLISHISLNQISLLKGGVSALREMLRLYDLPRSITSASQIDGIVGLEHSPATTWLSGKPFGSIVRGVEIRLTIDESHFIGSGIYVFTKVLEQFFALYGQANSFTQLVLISSNTEEELVRCPVRSGESILV